MKLIEHSLKLSRHVEEERVSARPVVYPAGKVVGIDAHHQLSDACSPLSDEHEISGAHAP